MRILQLVQKPQRRGAEVFAFHLSRELRQKEQEVRIAYLYPYEGQNGLGVGTSDILLNGRERSMVEVFPGISPWLLHRLQLLIADFQPDIVQANGARTVKYGAFARRFSRNGAWVLIYRNIGNPQDWLLGWARRFFYQRIVMPRIDGVVGVSQMTLQQLLDFYRLSIPAVHIPRGVDISLATPRASREAIRERTRTPPQSRVVLFVGSLTREKRLDRFLRVVGKLRLQLADVHAWVVGDGPLRLESERLVRSMGLERIVHFLGIESDIASVVNASDLLLLTSDTEGIPGVVLEAGLVGVPVVATSVGGVHECVLDNQTGVLVASDDEGRMAQVVLELLMDLQKRKEMGQRAREWVAQNFEIGRIASKYLEFYDYVLKESRN